MGRAQEELGTCRAGVVLLHVNIDLTLFRGGPHQKGAVVPHFLASESLIVVSEPARSPIAVVVKPIPTYLLVANLGVCWLSAGVTTGLLRFG